MGLKFQPLVYAGLTFGGSGGGGSSPTIGQPVVDADPNSVLIVDSSGDLADVVLTNGQLLIGRTGNTPVAASLTGTANQVIITPASGSITLSLPQSIATTSSPTFANINLSPSGVLDITGGGTLAIGTGNADIINIGNSGATINIQGDTFYQNVTNLNVQDKNITVNYGGSAGSGSNAGINVEENSVVTGYIDTTADRLGWELKAPATAGIITLVPGASGFTLNQGSHNPVTIGIANGLSLVGQALSLALASTSTTGALSSTDWNTFNDKLSSPVDLETQVTGILPYDNGGLGINDYQGANRIFGFNGTNDGIETKVVSGLAGIVVTNGSNIISIRNLAVNTGDIFNTSWSGLANNTTNQNITGFTFANSINSFSALLNIFIDATSDTRTTVKITGTRMAANWSGASLQVQFSGNQITDLDFTITSGGQVQITIGNITGFSSGLLNFRAITV